MENLVIYFTVAAVIVVPVGIIVAVAVTLHRIEMTKLIKEILNDHD